MNNSGKTSMQKWFDNLKVYFFSKHSIITQVFLDPYLQTQFTHPISSFQHKIKHETEVQKLN